MRFTNNNKKCYPFLEEVKYTVLRDLALYIFPFSTAQAFYQVTLENITNNFPLGYTQASHKYTPIISMFSLCPRLRMTNSNSWNTLHDIDSLIVLVVAV